MKLSQLDSSFNQLLTQPPKLKVAAEFYLNKFRFLIIAGCNSSKQQAKFSIFLDNQEQIVGQFQVEGETYTIIKESELDRQEKLNLAQILTARELQIATLIAQGKSNKQIAKQLQISKWTVSTHIRRIFMKLQVDNRAAMVYYCFGSSSNGVAEYIVD